MALKPMATLPGPEEAGQAALILERARSLVQSGWCQGRYAHNGGDQPWPWHSSAAKSFCLMGALRRAWLDLLDEEAQDRYRRQPTEMVDGRTGRALADIYPASAWARALLERALDEKTGGMYLLHVWNDRPGRTREEVLGLLGEALVLARSFV